MTIPVTHTSFRNMIKQVNTHKRVISEEDITQAFAEETINEETIKFIQDDMHYILVDKHQAKHGSRWKVSHRVKE